MARISRISADIIFATIGGYEGNLEFYGPKTAEKMVEEINIGIKNLDAN